MHQPDFLLTYRRPVQNLTVPENAPSSLSISLFDTHFEGMASLPWFVENECIEILLYPNGQKFYNDL